MSSISYLFEQLYQNYSNRRPLESTLKSSTNRNTTTTKSSNTQNRDDKDRFLVGWLGFAYVWGTRGDKREKGKLVSFARYQQTVYYFLLFISPVHKRDWKETREAQQLNYDILNVQHPITLEAKYLESRQHTCLISFYTSVITTRLSWHLRHYCTPNHSQLQLPLCYTKSTKVLKLSHIVSFKAMLFHGILPTQLMSKSHFSPTPSNLQSKLLLTENISEVRISLQQCILKRKQTEIFN